VQLATDIGDTVKRIDGTEVPLLAPWGQAAPTSGVVARPAGKPANAQKPTAKAKVAKPKKAVEKKTAEKKAEKKAPAKKVKAVKSVETEATDAGAETKPRTMKAPRKAGADDLKRISGVGPKLEGVLNDLGFWHFDQIAKWTETEVAWVDNRLKFKGRIERDNWIDQAKSFAQDD